MRATGVHELLLSVLASSGKKHPDVAGAALGALAHLAATGVLNREYARDKLKAVPVVVRALQRHGTNAFVAELGAKALGNLALGDTEEIFASGGAVVLHQLFKTHDAPPHPNESVVEAVCGAVANLAETEFNQERLTTAGFDLKRCAAEVKKTRERNASIRAARAEEESRKAKAKADAKVFRLDGMEVKS